MSELKIEDDASIGDAYTVDDPARDSSSTFPTMPTTRQLMQEAQSLSDSEPKKAEKLYKDILQGLHRG